MKIVMREDVEKVGDKGTVQSVSDGFARNYLIPKGFAVLATPGEMKTVAQNEKVQARKIAKQEEQLQSLSDKIDGQRLEFTARASDQGRLFGSVTSGDIAERLEAQIGEAVDRRKIVLDEAIRSTGEHRVTVHLVGRLRPEVIVKVTAEEIVEEASEEPAAATEEETETTNQTNEATEDAVGTDLAGAPEEAGEDEPANA
jgi:large subunit ribosomal protein L9